MSPEAVACQRESFARGIVKLGESDDRIDGMKKAVVAASVIAGELSVLSSDWEDDRAPRNMNVAPGGAILIRERFPCEIERVFVRLARASRGMRVCVIRVGDRVVCRSEGGSFEGIWVGLVASRDDYVVVEICSDASKALPLRLQLWAQPRGRGDLLGVAVGYPPGPRGAAEFADSQVH